MKYAVRFHFHGGGRPAASAGGAARPAAGGRRPGQRGVPTRAATVDRERWTSAAARLVRCVTSRTVLWLYWALSHHRICRYGSRVISLRSIWLFMWPSSCTCFEYTLVAYKHTYFVQRNRMKCGHSRNLFYVSRSCFSFYLHTFVTHLNKWNTRWDFIFTAAAGRPPALAALPGPLRAAVDQNNAVYRREPLPWTANGEPVPRHD